MAEGAATRPRFYTSILATRDPTLQIPEKFVAEHGCQLSEKVVLKLPSGAKWQVKVSRNRVGGMWFDGGWREFAEFYSIAPDNLLVFELHGHGTFLVFIFTQIVYRTQQLEEADVHVKVECEEADSYAESLPSPKTREKPPLKTPQPPPSKLRRTLNSDKHRSENPRKQSNQILHSSGGLEAANAFTSDVPFFKVVMSRTNISSKPLLTIPTKFHKHIGEAAEKAELWFEGLHWGVNISHYPNPTETSGKTVITSGWKAFAVANSLKEGDVCIFERVKFEADTRRMIDLAVLRVHVFRR